METLDLDRFWSKVDKSAGACGCWPWREGKNDRGYGYVNIGRSCIGAHRVAYRSVHGEIPKGLMIRHSCDNPACCNPAHLEPGTQTDNMQDMLRRGRCPPRWGKHSPRARLTEKQVLAIHEMRKGGAKNKEIAAAFNVQQSCISRILTGKRWAYAV